MQHNKKSAPGGFFVMYDIFILSMKYNKTFSKNQINEIAQMVLARAMEKDTESAVVVALSGDLGAGKTTLAQHIAEDLCIADNVISPTYVLMKKYEILSLVYNPRFTHLIHIDAYRIEDIAEMKMLGWEGIVSDSHNLIIVEWPEKISPLIPVHALSVSLAHHDQDTRLIVVE